MVLALFVSIYGIHTYLVQRSTNIKHTRNDGRNGAGGVCVRFVVRELEWDFQVEYVVENLPPVR